MVDHAQGRTASTANLRPCLFKRGVGNRQGRGVRASTARTDNTQQSKTPYRPADLRLQAPTADHAQGRPAAAADLRPLSSKGGSRDRQGRRVRTTVTWTTKLQQSNIPPIWPICGPSPRQTSVQCRPEEMGGAGKVEV